MANPRLVDSVCVCVCYTCMHTVEEYEGSVIHVEIVPSMLIRINVCDYPVYLVCAFPYF